MIRKYRDSDLDALKEITAACFDGVSIDHNIERAFGLIDGRDWQSRKVRHIDADVAANADGIFVAEEDGEVIGYVTARVDHAGKVGWIPNLSVRPEYQRRGIGRRLLRTALDYFRAEGMLLVRIETLEQNEVGMRFYPEMGFKEVARQIHYAMRL